MAENPRDKSTIIILLSLVLNAFRICIPTHIDYSFQTSSEKLLCIVDSNKCRKSELVQVQRISVYGIHSPKWDISVMPTPANTQGRRGRKNLRARGWEDCRKTVSSGLLLSWPLGSSGCLYRPAQDLASPHPSTESLGGPLVSKQPGSPLTTVDSCRERESQGFC